MLQEFDSVEVLDRRVSFPSGQIFIEGAVNVPTIRPFVEHESLRDAIERSGGPREDAQAVTVFRRRVGAAYSDTTSVQFDFSLGKNFRSDSALARFMLERDDHVVARASAGFRAQQFVLVEGQFKFTGTYAITENSDHVRDLVARAGGALPGAYGESFHLERDGKQVSVDFARAMRGDEEQNILLRGGDKMIIDVDPRTVFVTGAVSRPSLIRFRPGLSVSEYVELAGGPTEKGMADKAFVEYPSGFSKRITRVALLFRSEPPVVSGSTITVPERPDNKASAGELWTRVFQVSAALASLVLAYAAIIK